MQVNEVREVIIFLVFLMGFVLYAVRVSRLEEKIYPIKLLK